MPPTCWCAGRRRPARARRPWVAGGRAATAGRRRAANGSWCCWVRGKGACMGASLWTVLQSAASAARIALVVHPVVWLPHPARLLCTCLLQVTCTGVWQDTPHAAPPTAGPTSPLSPPAVLPQTTGCTAGWMTPSASSTPACGTRSSLQVGCWRVEQGPWVPPRSSMGAAARVHSPPVMQAACLQPSRHVRGA